MPLITPVLNEPALLLEKSPTTRYLLIADLHLGIEYTLTEKGIDIPTELQTNRLIGRLKRIIKRTNPSKLIILGDIKHSVPHISQMDWHIIPAFFDHFLEFPIHVILGNHESAVQIEGLTTRNVQIHPASGCLLNLNTMVEKVQVALCHGHVWPAQKLFNADMLIMAHNHPVIEFRDELKTRTYEPAWIRLHWNRLKMAKAYLKYRNIKNPKHPLKILQKKFQMTIKKDTEIIIMPAFNDLLGGIPFNRKDSQFIGPLMKSNSLNIDEAEVMLLDGTYLGKIKNITAIGSTEKSTHES
ncbi:MAG: metallophosphoesterase [Candidatus Helarchaeota archaeon]